MKLLCRWTCYEDFIFQKLELTEGETTVSTYMDNLNEKPLCFNILAIQSSIVESLEDATVEVYDYYEPREPRDLFD